MATPDWYGYITAGFGLGNIFGFAIAGSIKAPGSVRSRMNIAAIISSTIFLTVFGFLRVKELVVVNMFMAGLTQGYYSVNVFTVLQQTTPDWIRGRVPTV